MKQTISLWLAAALGIALSACSQPPKQANMETYEKGTFGYDLHYLQAKDSLVVLSDAAGEAQVIVSPGYQGKVFTSTASGLRGPSLGYLNYKALDATELNPHMNGYGGENRFWLGPEGGRYSVYFAPGDAQVYDNWHTPKPTDSEPWQVVGSGPRSVSLAKAMDVQNYKGTRFHLKVDRSIHLLSREQIADFLAVPLPDALVCVGYATENTVTNRNDFAWTPETGTICIWMLDMFNTAPRSLTIVPYQKGDAATLGRVATTDYFGEIPADRLRIEEETLYLRTDGRYRSKLGLNSRRTRAIAGNYDPDQQRLTIATFDVDRQATYLNQEWNPAKDPLQGDALNAYNDGPLDDGSLMGPFLEIESASPAAFLRPGETLTHHHQVFHFIGTEAQLTPISSALLGSSIEKLKNIFEPLH